MYMNVTKECIQTTRVIPLMAALPYRIAADEPEGSPPVYDPKSQLTRFASRDFSTCREDESVFSLFASKADTKKDD